MTGNEPDGIVERLRESVDARSVEDRLLLAAARINPGPADLDCLEGLLGCYPDWRRVVEKAENHWVAPLAYRTLSRQPFASMIPEAALSRLQARYLHNGVSNLLWLRRLANLVTTLHRHGLPVVLLKGAALLHTVFPDPALRQLRDLDLLVQRHDLSAVEVTLEGLGYSPAEDQWPFGKWPAQWYEKKYLKASVGKQQTLVEIHWQLSRKGSPFKIGIEELMGASEPVQLEGAEARVLHPAHQILHLCTHLAYNDGFGVGLSRPSDLHETVERFGPKLDWDQLAAEARGFQASQCLRYSLAVAAALFGTTLPPSFLERPGDPPMRLSLAQAALERVLSGERETSPLPSTQVKLIAFDRVGLGSMLRMLLPRPRQLKHAYRLLDPRRVARALRYARAIR